MSVNKFSDEIKPITVRQLALAFLVITIIGSLIALIIIKHSSNNEFEIYHGEVVPDVIKPKSAQVTSKFAPESMSFLIPQNATSSN